MKIYYIVNARMPTDKAHGIQVAKMCEAFIEAGVDVTLVFPRRFGIEESMREHYDLRVDIPVVRLPAFDWGMGGPFYYRLSALTFVCSYLWFFYTAIDRKNAVVYTVDLDHITCVGLPFLGLPYFSEMHGGKPRSLFYRLFFKRMRGIIATTTITRDELVRKFHLLPERVLFEPNGVDFAHLSSLSRESARRELGLPIEKPLALYVGRALSWKGIAILPEAAALISDITLGFLGGTEEEFKAAFGVPGAPVVFYGSKPHNKVGTWLAAADVCLVIGTRHDEYSYRYTSPMKVYEYLASGRPIIASSTPALHDVLGEDECYFCEPDDAGSLAKAIAAAVADPVRSEHIAEKGIARAREHTWQKRAERTKTFIEQLTLHSK
ncbi:MAG: glycosyltransferase [Minisyncoccia bacterium]